MESCPLYGPLVRPVQLCIFFIVELLFSAPKLYRRKDPEDPEIGADPCSRMHTGKKSSAETRPLRELVHLARLAMLEEAL